MLASVFLGLLLLLVILAACAPNLQPRVDQLEKKNQALKEIAGILPASLDNFFPPKAPAPVWLLEMFGLAGPFEGIDGDLQQGQVDNACKDFEAFKTRFKTLAGACSNCHATPRAYFVDASIQGMVDQLGQALAATTPNPRVIGQLSGAIGNECLKCHWVHFPAQNTKVLLEKAAELTK